MVRCNKIVNKYMNEENKNKIKFKKNIINI